MITSRIYALNLPITAIVNAPFAGVGVYQVLTTGLDEPCFRVRINNQSDVVIRVSYDGVNWHDTIPAMSVLDILAPISALPHVTQPNFPSGMPIYIAGSAISAGYVVCSAYTYYHQ